MSALGVLSSAGLLIALVGFLAVAVPALRRRAIPEFDRAARLPLDDSIPAARGAEDRTDD